MNKCKHKFSTFHFPFSINQKGFSLVELIIVIAIMAILIAILAPMFVRYVERSRIAIDVDAIGGMARALKVVLAEQVEDPPPSNLRVVWDCGTGAIQVGTINGAIGVNVLTASQNAFTELVNTPVLPRSQTLRADPVNTRVIITMNDTAFGGTLATAVTGIPSQIDTTYFHELLTGIN